MSLETTLLYTLLRGRGFSASKYVGAWLSRQRASSTGLITDERRGLGTDRPLQDGKAVTLNGTNQYGVTADTSIGDQLGITTNLSASIWFKADVTSGNDGILNIGTLASTQGELAFTLIGNNLGFRLDGSVVNLTVAFTDTTAWHHVALTYDGVNVVGYLDGEVVVTQPYSANLNCTGQSVVVGAYVNNILVFDGLLFDPRVYNKGLTSSEIKHVYTFGRSGTNPGTGNLLGHYKLDELSGFDSSGNRNHLTWINSPTQYTGADVPFSWQNSAGYTEGKNMITYGNLGDADVGIGSSPYGLDGMQIQGTQGGVSASIVGTGEIDGVSYLDYRVVGTNSSGSTYFFNIITNASADPSLEIPAVEGDVHTISAYLQLIAGSLTGTTRIFYVHQRTAGGVLLVGGAGSVDPDGTLTRYSRSPICPATTAKIVNRGMYVGVATGNTVDITLRVGNLQVERGPLTDYQATKGVYSYGKLLPRDESTPTLDVFSNELTYQGIAPSPGQLVQSNCLTLNGTNQGIPLGTLTGNLHSFRCRFYADVEINNASPPRTLLHYDSASGNNAILFGTWTTGLTGEVIAIGALVPSPESFPRTGVVDITIPIGWHELEVVWNGSHYDFILDGITQVATASPQGHVPLETFGGTPVIGNRGTSYYNSSLCDIEIKTDASTVVRNIPCSEGAGEHVTDTVTGTQYAIQEPGSNWGVTQDVFHQNYEKGFSVANNLLTYSNDFANGAWVKSNGSGSVASSVTATGEFYVNEDGLSIPIYRLVASISGATSSDFSLIQQVLGTVSGTFTGTIYAKSNTGSSQLAYYRISGFDPSSNASITTDWSRLPITQTVATGTHYLTIGLRGSATGISTLDILVAGGQVVRGTESPPYYPTTSIAYDNVKIPAQTTDPTLDCNDVPLTNPPKIGLNGAETRAEFCSNPNAPEFFDKEVPGDGVLAAYQFDGDPGDVVIGRDLATEEGKFSLRKII